MGNTNNTAKNEINTRTLGGWLIAIQVFIILNAISWVTNLQLYYKLLGEKEILIKEKNLSDPSILNVFFYYELAASLVFTFLAFVVFYYFFKRNKLFPMLMIIYLVFELVVEGVSYLLFAHLSNDPVLMLQKMAFSLVIAVAMIIYLKRSERVKQTFIF
ncbi:MAG: hypothetical protein UZ05_CHB002000691 [Chlorobi bacterium OLB5]|nr:MAG: hypothetical protein UZ05_CHB002000691 [Chlorobi bacterium OLB5]